MEYESMMDKMCANVLPRYREVVEAGQKVLIVTDSNIEPVVWRVFASCARALGAHPFVLCMEPLPRDYVVPDQMVFKAGEQADVVHCSASTALVHTDFGRYMFRKLMKGRINSDNITARQLLEGAILATNEEINKYKVKVDAIWNKGNSVHVTTQAGTDITLSIEGRHPFAHPKGLRSIQFPGGEAMLPPLEDTANGTIIVDKTIHYIGAVTEPVRLEVKDGTIMEISGGDSAVRYQQWLETFADESGWRLGELAVGVNPKAFWMGSPRQDRFVLGSCHFGFGLNADVGGTIEGNIHYDVILSKPTITVDDQVIIKNGIFKI